MKIFLRIFFTLHSAVLFSRTASSQSFAYHPVIIDKETRSPIAFAKFFRKKGSIYFYSDEHGKLTLPSIITQKDTLIVSRMGYNSITVDLASRLRLDTLELIKQPVLLNEIRVENDKRNRLAKYTDNFIIGTIKQKKKTVLNFCEPDIVAVFIPNPQNEPGHKIKSLLAKISNANQLKTGAIFLNIHQTTSIDSPPGPVIYRKELTLGNIRQYTKNDLLEVQVDSAILFPASGIYVSFQWSNGCPSADNNSTGQIGLQVTESIDESVTWVKLRKPEPPTWYREGTPYSVSWRFPDSFRLLNAMMAIRID